MRGGLLLDTHAILWYLDDDARMSEDVYAQIDDGDRRVVASAVSFWEIAIKSGLGKLRAEADLPERLRLAGIEQLAVTPEHAWAVRDLPHHHRDPFDRLLVAQAQRERLSLVTRDPAFAAYDVDVVW